MQKNQTIDITKIIARTSAMLTVRCASVNRAPAVAHELDAEARVQACTSAGNKWIWKDSWGVVLFIEQRKRSSS